MAHPRLHAALAALLGSRLARNFLSLSAVQVANGLLPLVTLPYLARVLGLEKFGIISYALALVTLFTVFVEYGYGLVGVRAVALHRDSPEVLGRLVSRKLLAQGLLLGAAALMLAALLAAFPALRQWWFIHLATFGLVPAAILSPAWLLQGLETPALAGQLALANRLAYVGLVFALVRTEADYWLVPVLNSATALAAAGLGLWIAMRRRRLRLVTVPAAEVLASLRHERPAFVATFSSSAYPASSVLILGAFASEAVVGVFAMVDRIIWACRLALGTLFSVLYPRVCVLMQAAPEAAKRLLRRVLGVLLVPVALLSAALLLLAEPIVHAALGQPSPEGAAALRLLAFVPLLLVLNTGSYQLLLADGRQRESALILLLGSLAGVALNLLLAPQWYGAGTAVSVVAAELIVAAGLILATEFRHQGLTLWRPGSARARS